MKYLKAHQSLVLFLILIFINNSLSSKISNYAENDAKTFSKFSKLASCATKPLKVSCPKCINPGNGYKFYFFYQTTRINKFNYKFMIHYNDTSKRIVVSFAGPSATEHIYIKYIYSSGFSLVKKYNFQIEKEFYQIYFNKIRRTLQKKLMKMKSSGRKSFQIYFTGHSIGGSLATLAALDLQQNKIFQNVKVFSFAPLRLGDAAYVTMVNSYLEVYRIVKKSDYLVRIPNCYFSRTYKIWRCFNEQIIKEFIVKPSFPLKVYVGSYLKYYTKSNSILSAAIIYARKRLNSRGRVTRKNTKVAKKNNKKNSRVNRRKGKNTKKTLRRKAKKLRKRSMSIRKFWRKLLRKLRRSRKTLKRYNPKKLQKSAKSIAKHLKKLKNKKIGKKSSKNLKNLIKKARKINKRKLKKKTSLLRKKVRRFFKEVKKIAKKIYRKAHRLLKKSENLSKKSKRRINKKSKKPTKKTKKSTKSKKVSPIKKLANKSKLQNIVSNSYTYIPTTFKVYTPLQTYFTFVYYTQPIGFQIFYNDAMTEYTICQYVNGISLCEKVVTLPLQFSNIEHFTYFGNDFTKC